MAIKSRDAAGVLNPQKFSFWLSMVSIVMMFASLTSAYIVRKSMQDAPWLDFQLPAMFRFSTAVIIASSVTMQLAHWATKRDQLSTVKVGLFLTLVLGIVFLIAQWLGWSEIYNYDFPVVFAGRMSNPAGSFLYVLSGLHGLHILSALFYVAVMIVKAYRGKVHSRNRLNMDMSTTFWHFLGGVWVLMYVFLIFQHNG